MEIKEFIPLVRSIAVVIRRPMPSSILLDDLIQDGMIGLIYAFRDHDPSVGVPFPAYAASKIRWAILEGLRASDWMGRTARQEANKVARTTSELEARLCRRATMSEVAAALGVRVNDVAVILSHVYGQEFVSIGNENSGILCDIPDSSMEPHAIVERRQACSRAVACLKTLNSKERRAFILSVMCEMSLSDAAREMGLSKSRVCQLCKAAAKKLAECAGE